MAKKIDLKDTAKKFVTRKETWRDVKTGLIAGASQSVGVAVLGKTFGTIVSAMGIGIMPKKWMSDGGKKIAVINQVSDATANLLIGE